MAHSILLLRAKGSVVLISAGFLLRTICLIVCDCMFKRYIHARSAGQPPDCQALAETGLAVIRTTTLTAPMEPQGLEFRIVAVVYKGPLFRFPVSWEGCKPKTTANPASAGYGHRFRHPSGRDRSTSSAEVTRAYGVGFRRRMA